MTQPRRKEDRGTRRFVHLGDRLLAIERIRAGGLTLAQAAVELGVEPGEVLRWLEAHADERTVTFEELRSTSSSRATRLARRAQTLAVLVAKAEVILRHLHQEYLRSAVASNEPFAAADESSKHLAENPHLRSGRVASAQPKRT